MTETIDWAPYANDGEAHKCMVPKGIPLSLTTDDIEGARYAPTIRTFLHPPYPPEGGKMYPNAWLPRDFYEKKRPSRRLITDRVVNPLDPEYKIPSGVDKLPAGDQIFSNRVTDLLDVSDIVGAKPRLLFKGPVRVRLEDIVFDKKSHPAKWTRERLRCPIGTGLELFDINIGKKRFGFERHPRTNPVEPLYPTEVEETAEQKFKRLKRKMIAPRSRFWQNGDPVIERVMEKLYWKSPQLTDACKHYDVGRTDRISYENLRNALAQFGVHFTDEEYQRLIPYADKEGEGCVPFFRFAKCLRWPSGLEKIGPKRIGQEQWEGVYTNLGQGLQVLVEEPGITGKKQMKEVEDAYHLVNLITGDPLVKHGTTLIPPREMLCLSYLEQLADEENTKRDLMFKSFMPADPPGLKMKPIPYVRPAQSETPAPAPAPAPEVQAEQQNPPQADQPGVATVVPPIVPPSTAAAPNVSPKKSVVISPKKSPPVELPPAPAPALQPPEGAPVLSADQTVNLEEFKSPVQARKSMAPPERFDSMPTFQSMKQATRTKRVNPASFRNRIKQERRNEAIQSVLYLA